MTGRHLKRSSRGSEDGAEEDYIPTNFEKEADVDKVLLMNCSRYLYGFMDHSAQVFSFSLVTVSFIFNAKVMHVFHSIFGA